MNKREFVCRGVLRLLPTALMEGELVEIPDADLWQEIEEIWDARPQWMKDEDQLAEDAKQGYFKGKLIARLTPEDRREYEEFLGNMSSSPRVDGA